MRLAAKVTTQRHLRRITSGAHVSNTLRVLQSGQAVNDGAPEQNLQVVGQLCSASIPGIHGDGDKTCVGQANVMTFKQESLQASSECIDDAQKLLSNHRENFQVDAIELHDRYRFRAELKLHVHTLSCQTEGA
jgi:hypothetical protein